MSLVTIIQGACAQSNVPVPSSVIGNTDQNVVQMLYLLNREGKWFQRIHDWQVLRKESSFLTLAANTQIADLTSYTDSASASVTDWDRFVPETMWNRTLVQPVRPTTHTKYAYDQARGVSTTWPQYMVRGNALLFTAAPTAGQSVFFEQVSKNWAKTAGGVGKAAFTLDSDLSYLNEELLTQALLCSFLKATGLDYAEEFRRLEMIYSSLTGQEMPMPDLIVGGFDIKSPMDPYVPESGFGV